MVLLKWTGKVERMNKKAFEYFKKATELSYNNGIYMTAYCYRNGFGVQRNIQKANVWYRKFKDSLKTEIPRTTE